MPSMMKTLSCLLVCIVLLAGCAAAEQEVLLPGGRFAVDVPDWMEYSDPVDGDAGVEAYISDDLEMDFVAATKEDMIALGMAADLQETAREKRAAGEKVKIQDVNGIRMLFIQAVDDADNAPCLGYVIEDGEWIIEINFWYATQEAADEAKKIMESIREIDI